ncbi:hypothetical protein BKA64DRAFT_751140 [Cadophora sp. MPI-SDFR-AT-0126]|nr:hypothetical protein BKA64DRAFT_751140 [Leotiomycetes sp. MPI-SDFR-AT-0126]
MAPRPSVNMDATLVSLLGTGKYHDLLIRCKSETFKVHRAVVCSASDAIAAAVDRWQKEDVKIAEFDMSSDELSVVKAFIDFLYKASYDCGDCDTIVNSHPKEEDTPENDPDKIWSELPMPGSWSDSFGGRFPSSLEEDSEGEAARPSVTHKAEDLPFHVKMYIAGDFYNVQSLKDYALNSFINATMDIEALLPKHAATLAESVKLCWEGTDQNDTKMRDVMAEFAFDNLELAMSSDILREILPQEDTFSGCLLQAASRLCQKAQRQVELDHDWVSHDERCSFGRRCGRY